MIYGAELEAYAERLVNRKLLDNLIDSGKISSMIYGAELKAYYARGSSTESCMQLAGWPAATATKTKGSQQKISSAPDLLLIPPLVQ